MTTTAYDVDLFVLGGGTPTRSPSTVRTGNNSLFRFRS